MLTAPALTLALALLALVISGRYTIRLLINITQALGLSEFSVAFVFLAVATSVPELFVSVASALQNAGDIVLAVALGSNVVNMTLIIGLATLVSAGIATHGLNLKRDITMGIGVNLMPIIFLTNGIISRIEGLILLSAFFLYVALLWRDGAQYTGESEPRNIFRGLGSVFGIIIVIAVLLVAAHQTVESSLILAEAFSLPPFLIGIFLLSVGTSLPELTTTLQSAYQKKPTLALGNILGSNIADSALIVGVASMVRPLEVTIDPSLVITIISVILTLVVIATFAFSKSKISIPEGLFLLLMFLLFSLGIIVTAPVLT